MKRLIILILALSVSIRLDAQKPPGYQGKRSFLEAGVSMIPTFLGPTVNDHGLGSSRSFAMSTRFRLGVYHTISRRHNFRVAYDYALTGMDFYNYSDEYYTFYKLSVHAISLGFDMYIGKASLAPLGFYFTPSLTFVYAKGILDRERSSLDLPSSVLANRNKFDVAVGGQLGYRAIFANRMTLNFAIEQHWFFSYLGEAFEYYGGFNTIAAKRLQGHFFFNIHIGVGILF